MRQLVGLLMISAFMVVTSANSAYAACCGVVSYTAYEDCEVGCASDPCEPTHTVMRTRRRVVWEPKEITCYKNVYETVCEEKTIDCVRYERETRYKECKYTVCKPIRETHYRECNYTVCKPVWETKTKEICYTVCKPVWETKTKEICYPVCKPGHETRERVVCQTIRKPVHYTKEVKVCGGHWETQVTECPGRVIKKRVREPGCWKWDPCKCRCVYCPGECKVVCVQCPPRQVCKKVWVPEVQTKTVNCVRYEREVVKKKVPYTVCKMVPETRTKTCTYKVCKMVKEQRTKKIPYTVCRYEKETRVKKVPYTVCKPVHYTKVITVPKRVCKKVACTRTICVPRVVCEQVPVEVCSDPCRGGLLNRILGAHSNLLGSCESEPDCGREDSDAAH